MKSILISLCCLCNLVIGQRPGDVIFNSSLSNEFYVDGSEELVYNFTQSSQANGPTIKTHPWLALIGRRARRFESFPTPDLTIHSKSLVQFGAENKEFDESLLSDALHKEPVKDHRALLNKFLPKTKEQINKAKIFSLFTLPKIVDESSIDLLKTNISSIGSDSSEEDLQSNSNSSSGEKTKVTVVESAKNPNPTDLSELVSLSDSQQSVEIAAIANESTEQDQASNRVKNDIDIVNGNGAFIEPDDYDLPRTNPAQTAFASTRSPKDSEILVATKIVAADRQSTLAPSQPPAPPRGVHQISPQNSPQSPPQNSPQRPPQNSPQRPPQNPPQRPPQNPPQRPPQIAPQRAPAPAIPIPSTIPQVRPAPRASFSRPLPLNRTNEVPRLIRVSDAYFRPKGSNIVERSFVFPNSPAPEPRSPVAAKKRGVTESNKTADSLSGPTRTAPQAKSRLERQGNVPSGYGSAGQEPNKGEVNQSAYGNEGDTPRWFGPSLPSTPNNNNINSNNYNNNVNSQIPSGYTSQNVRFDRNEGTEDGGGNNRPAILRDPPQEQRAISERNAAIPASVQLPFAWWTQWTDWTRLLFALVPQRLYAFL